jgi:hypothetical protein
MRTGNEAVERILSAAADGEAMPAPDSPAGVTLHALADPSGESYDPRFARRIAELRPEWFADGALNRDAPPPRGRF